MLSCVCSYACVLYAHVRVCVLICITCPCVCVRMCAIRPCACLPAQVYSMPMCACVSSYNSRTLECIVALAAKLSPSHTPLWRRFRAAVRRMLCTNHRTHQPSLLHSACTFSHKYDCSVVHENYVSHFGLDPTVVEMLLGQGAEAVHAKDHAGDTAMHKAAQSYVACSAPAQEHVWARTAQENIAVFLGLLISHGAHADARNLAGRTPVEVLGVEWPRVLQRLGSDVEAAMRVPRLGCLAARVVSGINGDWRARVPASSVAFVELH